jgi:hypothetical protein
MLESPLSLPSNSPTDEAEWTSFQIHYFSENLVVPGIEHRTSESVASNSDLETESTVKLIKTDIDTFLA